MNQITHFIMLERNQFLIFQLRALHRNKEMSGQINIFVYWDAAPFSLVDIERYLSGTSGLYFRPEMSVGVCSLRGAASQKTTICLFVTRESQIFPRGMGCIK
jgi:hypothetical protein